MQISNTTGDNIKMVVFPLASCNLKKYIILIIVYYYAEVSKDFIRNMQILQLPLFILEGQNHLFTLHVYIYNYSIQCCT